jgi:magnesium-protoporphyrin IX monomethyl ester (oxidative) cyclase
MEKVLLINPGQNYYPKTFRASKFGSLGLPLGLLYAASIFKNKGCTVKVIDCLVSNYTQIKKYKNYIHYGIPENTLTHLIKEYDPQIVGIENQFAIQEEQTVRVAEITKGINNSILVIVGGANVSCRGKQILSNSYIDIGVKGESEKIIEELIDYYRQKKHLKEIDGIVFRKENKIIENKPSLFIENLDEIPLPAYDLVDMEKYLTLYKKGIYTRDRDVKRSISMITSRGCPHNCVFCSVHQSMGKRWRFHSTKYIKNHIIELSKKYNIRHIHFEDDNLLMEMSRFLPILDTLHDEKITWDTPNGIRADLDINENILMKIKKSGCKSLTIGVESGDQQILQNIVKKSLQLSKVVEFAKLCKQANIPLRAFFILGFPGETIQTMKKTVNFALMLLEKYNVEIINLIATPLFGTELYNICEQNNYFAKEITTRTLSESTVSNGDCLIQTKEFSASDVEYLSKLLTRQVFKKLILEGLRHPIPSLKRVGNIHTLTNTLKRLIN